MHLDMTISVGNILTILAAVIAAIFAWRDMDWRVKNLELWRLEQIKLAEAQAEITRHLGEAITDLRLAIAATWPKSS